MKNFCMKLNTYLFLFILLFSYSCKEKEKTPSTMELITSEYPKFNADTAYYYIEKQVEFGPRVPNTKEHDLCAEFLVKQLKKYGAEVEEQSMELTAYDGTLLKATNIIASYHTEKTNRVLLMAHWDTRPYADNDLDEANHRI